MPRKESDTRKTISLKRGNESRIIVTAIIGYGQAGSTLIRLNKQNITNDSQINSYTIPILPGEPNNIDMITSIFDVNPNTDKLSVRYNVQFGNKSSSYLLEGNSNGDGTSLTFFFFIKISEGA